MQSFSILSLLIKFILPLISISVLYLVYTFGYCFFIKPYLRVKYFLKQGGVGKFCSGPQFFIENQRNAQIYGDSMRPYVEALKKDPNIKFFVRSIGSQPLVILADIGMAKQFYQNQQDYDKSSFFKEMHREFEAGVFLTVGETWRQNRKLLSPFFTFESLKKAVPMIISCTRETYTRWIKTSNLQQNAISMCSQVSGEIILKYLFNIDLEAMHTKDGKLITDLIVDFVSSLEGANDTLTRILFGPKFVEKGFFASHRRFTTCKQDFVKLAKTLLQQAKTNGVPKDTFLAKLIEIDKVGELVYTEDRMVADMMTLLVAGTDTNAHNVGYTIYFLAKNPKILQKLLAEIDREVTNLDKLDLDVINRLDYTNAVIKETLRLAHPLPWLFFREVLKPQQFGDVSVKPGDLITLSPTLFHLQERYYTQPFEYIPERWLPDGPFPNDGWKKEPFSYVAFSAGPRNCIGQHLGMIEAKIMLILFVKTFRFSVPEDYVLKINAAVLSEPVNKLIVTLDPISKTN